MKLLKISGLSLPSIYLKTLSNLQNFPVKNLYLTYFFMLIFIISSAAALPAEPVKKIDKSIDWFWVFYENTKDMKTSTNVYRPFYMESINDENLFQASLMPLIFWRYKNERYDTTKALFGLYESTEYMHEEKKEDYDSGLMPFYLYGSGDEKKDEYIFIYPFGGDIKGKLGYDRISPYIFPGIALFFILPPAGLFTLQSVLYLCLAIIPVYTEFESRDYTGTAIFWPFIAWGKGDLREDFRFIPFYSHNRKTGWYDNHSYLMVINYGELYLREDEQYTFFFFPFFGRRWSKSGNMNSYTVLWPFFSWGYDLDRKETVYNLPWPFIQIADSEKPYIKKRIFFPFWGKYETSKNESEFITPLYTRLKSNTDNFKSDYTNICFIFWYWEREYSYEHEYYGKSWRYFKIWPLIQVEWNTSGLYGINVLSIFPFRDESGYEKLYQPFWTLFEYRVKPDGEKHLGFLLRTYYQVWNDDFFKMKIPLVINYSSRGESVTEFTVLLSSFGYEKDKEGTYLKMLWIPLRIGEGDITLTENIEESDNDADILPDSREKYGFNSRHGNFAESGFENKIYFKTDFELF